MKSIKKITAVILSLICAVSVSACVPTERVYHENANSPGLEDTTSNTVLEGTQLYNDTLEVFENTAPYSYVRGFDIVVDNEEKMLYIKIVVVDEADADDIEHFISALLRHMNDAAAIQMGDIEISNGRGFGKLYDYFGITIGVYPESDPDNENAILYGCINQAGNPPDFDPYIEEYENQWQSDYEYYLKNMVYDTNGNVVEQ